MTIHIYDGYIVEIIVRQIQTIESRIVTGPGFTPSRYPYTYAYDYMRIHWQDFGIDRQTSRSDCARMMSAFSPEAEEACCVALADAYLREHNIQPPIQAITVR